MRGAGYADLLAFVTVAGQLNFSRAAEELGVSPSALSQTVKQLEERLGARLLHRTTRSVALTEAGERLLRRARPALAELDGAVDDVIRSRDRPAGVVRLRSGRLAFRTYVEPHLAAFHAAYPDIVLDVTIDSAVADIVAGGFDVGFTIGEVIEKDMIGVRIGPDLRHVAVAAPLYLESHGRPETPRDLLSHRCLRWRWPGQSMPYKWEFFADGAWFEVEVAGPLIVTEHHLLLKAALDGMGIAFMPDVEVKDLVSNGDLVPLLEAWSAPFPGYHLCYPQQRQMAPSLRAFIDFVKTAAAPQAAI